jgi:hypothetical protein
MGKRSGVAFRVVRTPAMARSVTRSGNRPHTKPRTVRPTIGKRGCPNWCAEEDLRLAMAVRVRPLLSWMQIAQLVGSRNADACQGRSARTKLESERLTRPGPAPGTARRPKAGAKPARNRSFADRLDAAAGFDGTPVEPMALDPALDAFELEPWCVFPDFGIDVASTLLHDTAARDSSAPDHGLLAREELPAEPAAAAESSFTISFREPPVAHEDEGPILRIARMALSTRLGDLGARRTLSMSYKDLWGFDSVRRLPKAPPPVVPTPAPAPRITDYWTKRRAVPHTKTPATTPAMLDPPTTPA